MAANLAGVQEYLKALRARTSSQKKAYGEQSSQCKNKRLTSGDGLRMRETVVLNSSAGNRFTSSAALLAALAVIAFFSFYRLEQLPLDTVDESTHISVSQEMFYSGDYFRPSLQGLPYLQKPPLKFWITQLSLRAFGDSLFAHRFVDGCGIALAAGALYTLVLLLSGSHFGALLGVVALFSSHSLLFSHGIRNATQESLLLAFHSLAGLSAVTLISKLEQRDYAKAEYLALVFGLFTGGALLLKSLFGIFPLAAFVLFSPWQRKQRHRYLHCALLAGLAAALFAVPYFVFVFVRETHGFQKLFLFEIWNRIFSGYNNSEQPFFYLQKLTRGEYLSPFILIAALTWAGSSAWIQKDNRVAFLLCWLITVCVSISIAKSRLIHYSYPAFIPAIALIGMYSSELWRKAGDTHRTFNLRVCCSTGLFAILALLAVQLHQNVRYITGPHPLTTNQQTLFTVSTLAKQEKEYLPVYVIGNARLARSEWVYANPLRAREIHLDILPNLMQKNSSAILIVKPRLLDRLRQRYRIQVIGELPANIDRPKMLMAVRANAI